jgi:peptide methionine sulfoxide reductase MsrA
MILRQTRLNELESMTSVFFGDAEPATMQKVIESIGKTYQAKLYRQIVSQAS